MHHVRPFLSHRPDGLIVPDPPLLSTPATPRVMPRAPRAGSPLKDPKHTL
jgi:hypothetical protein